MVLYSGKKSGNMVSVRECMNGLPVERARAHGHAKRERVRSRASDRARANKCCS